MNSHLQFKQRTNGKKENHLKWNFILKSDAAEDSWQCSSRLQSAAQREGGAGSNPAGEPHFVNLSLWSRERHAVSFGTDLVPDPKRSGNLSLQEKITPWQDQALHSWYIGPHALDQPP